MNRRQIKGILYVFILSFLFFMLPNNAFATDRGVRVVVKTEDKCKLNTNATGACHYANTNFSSLTSAVWIDNGDTVTLISGVAAVNAPKSGNGSECQTRFVMVSSVYNGVVYRGYICESYIWDGVIPSEHQTEFREAGFPESYWDGLSILKTAHPTWSFVAIDTELNFQTAVNNQDSGNKSLIQGNAGLLSTSTNSYNWSTDRFKVGDGASSGQFIAHNSSSWFSASNDTIAYFMDPRNFLKNMNIFQFESLSYNPDDQSIPVTAIQRLLGSAYISKFSQQFITAGETTKVNPVYLAALSRQEVGSGSAASLAVSGASFKYGGKTYSKLYNFYNIGATSGTQAAERGLVWANGGVNGADRTFGRPWNTEDKSISGGAEFTATRYIYRGQNTRYFKKFNTVQLYSLKQEIKDAQANHTHQYMQNVRAPSSEGLSTYRAYSRANIIDENFVFYIPVYRNMPAQASALPQNGNPNNRLNRITVNGTNISGFAHDTFSYTVHVANNITTANITVATINSNATVTAGTGSSNLSVGNNEVTITVRAQNGTTQNYTVNIVRAVAPEDVVHLSVAEILTNAKITNDGTNISNLTFTTNVNTFINSILAVDNYAEVTIRRGTSDLTSGNLQTGDIVTIVSGTETKTFNIVIFGDTDGSSAIDIVDLLRVQRHILGDFKLTGAQLVAADSNKDGRVDIVDLLRVQRHILGDFLITQN